MRGRATELHPSYLHHVYIVVTMPFAPQMLSYSCANKMFLWLIYTEQSITIDIEIQNSFFNR